MAKVSRQRRPKTKPKTTKRKGILSKMQPVEEMDRPPLRVCIYGPNRAGKTYLACQFEKPLALIAFEPSKGSYQSVADIPGVEYIRLTKIEEIAELARELQEDTYYKTVVPDSATSLQDVVLCDILGMEEMPVSLSFGTVTSDQYRERSETTRELLRTFMSLPQDVIVTAKERDHNPRRYDEEGNLDMRPNFVKPLEVQSYYGVDIGGAAAGWLQDSADYLFRLYKERKILKKKIKVGTKEKIKAVETDEYVRHLLVDYHPNFAGGCRLGSNRDKLPEEGILVEPTFQKLQDIFGF